jgi:hypothetical protein
VSEVAVSLPFQFDPVQMRGALDRLSKAFPAEGSAPPDGLAALFQRLAQMRLAEVGPWSVHLRSAQRDLLCDYYHRAPSSRVLAALAALLAHHRDRRFSPVLCLWFFFAPPAAEIREVQALWQAHSLVSLFDPHQAWLTRYLNSAEPDEPLQYVTACLEQDELDLNRLSSAILKSPLFEQLMDYIFAKGGVLMSRLQPEPLAQRAEAYLERGDRLRVTTYLRDVPERDWKPAFLERLASKLGNPDPIENDFYRRLPEGRIWSLRQVLFTARMRAASSPKSQQVFWQDYLHHCQNWFYRDGTAHITIRPLRIVETARESLVTMLENMDRVVDRIPCDNRWRRRMSELLEEYFGWRSG